MLMLMPLTCPSGILISLCRVSHYCVPILRKLSHIFYSDSAAPCPLNIFRRYTSVIHQTRPHLVFDKLLQPSSNISPQTSAIRLQTSDLIPQTSSLRPQPSDLRPHPSDLRLQTSDFRLQTSDLILQTSTFRLQTSDFRLQTSSNFLQRETKILISSSQSACIDS